MPGGMNLSAGGVLSGIPTTPGSNINIQFSLTDGTDTAFRSVNVNVSAISVAPVNSLAPGVLPNATQTVFYNQSVTASGGTGPYTWTANGLPFGLNINSGTGAITGTISSSSFGIGKSSVSVTAKDSLNVSYQKQLSIDVLGAVAVLPAVNPSGSSLDDCTIGVACSRNIQVQSGGAAPFAWAVSGLPAGMSMRTGSGVTSSNTTPGDAELWGTPTATGLFDVTVTVTDAAGATASNTFPLRVSPLLQTNSLGLGTPGAIDNPFSRTVRVIGGTLPYTVAQTAGLMPAGITLNTNTLVASGTPVESGFFGPVLTYTDSTGSPETVRATNSFSISSISFGTPVNINSTFDLGSVTTGSSYSNTLSASGPGGITWTQIGGTLPTGLTIGSGGLLSGTASASGVYTFVLKAASGGAYAARQFTLNVTPMAFSFFSPLPYGNVGTLYSQSLTATGGTGAVTWTVAPFSYLPPGLSLATNGTLGGTPTAKGQFTFTVIASDTGNHYRATSVTLSIYGPGEAPPVTQTQSASFGTRSIGQVELPLSATGGNGTYAWSLQSGSLPPGLAIRTDKPSSFSASASAGLIGVATTPGNYAFTLRVSSSGQTFDQASTLKITALTVKDQSTLPDAFVGTAYSYTLTPLNAAGAVTFTSTGSMPANMSLSAGGILSGTPTASANNFNISYSVNDGTDVVTRSANLTISAISVSATGVSAPGVLPNATQNSAYSVTLTASGGAGGFTFTASGLPNGLNLNGGTGVISGTPLSTNTQPGKFQVSVTAKDSLNVTYTKSMSMSLLPTVPVLPAVAPSGGSFDGCTIGVPCSRNVNAQNGGVAPFGWAVSGLPTGMSLRTGSGITGNNTTPGDAEVWGTPTVTGLFNVEVTVTDATGAAATNTFPLRVSTLLQTTSLSQGGNAPLNSPFSRSLRVIGGTLPYTVTQVGGTLSAGLTLDSNTLVANGTPVESGNFNPRLVYTDAGGPAQTLQATNNYTISGAGSGISINSNANLQTATLNQFYSQSVSASGSTTWSILSGALPGGLSLASNGGIAGTPTVAGVFTFLLKATDTNNSSNFAARQFTLNVTPITLNLPSPLPYGNVGTAYNYALTASNGTGALTWTLADFNYLPPGLSLAANGTLSGTPTATGLYSFSVTVADTASHTRAASVSMSIYPNGVVPPVGQTHSADFGTRSIGYLELPLSATGGDGSFTWSLQSGSLPPGMAIRSDKPSTFPGSASAGLSGVATTPGTYNFTLRVSSGGQMSDQASTLKITALTVKDLNSLPDAYAGVSYSYTLTPLGNAGAVTWTPTNGMPAGMNLSSSGVLSGTPSSATNAFITFTLSDGTDTVSRSISLKVQAMDVAAAGALAPGVLPNVTPYVPYSVTLAASGGAGGYTYSINGLPQGLSIDGATGVISGTVANTGADTGRPPGKYNLFVTVTDSAAASSTKNLSLTIIGSSPELPALFAQGARFDDCTIGVPCDRGVFTEYGGRAPFAWSISGLPTGMSYRTGSGVTDASYSPGDVQLWGTPTVTGQFFVTATITDADGAQTTSTFPLRVSVLAQTNFLQDGTLDTPYFRTIRIVGGTQPYGSAALTYGSFPAGLSFNTSTFAVSGTPIESPHENPFVTFTDGGGQTLGVTEYIRINGAGNGSVQLDDDVNTWITTGVFFSQPLFACCANSIVFSVIGGSMPPGVSLSAEGLVSGTPTVPGAYQVLIKAADGSNAANYAVRQQTITVTPLALTNPRLPFGNVGTAYTPALNVTGGTGVLTFVLEPFTYVPLGLTLNADGTFSGTPTASGQYVFTVIVTDQGGHSLKAEARLSIYPAGVGEAPLITAPPSNKTILSGAGTTFTVAASGVPAPEHRWQVSTNGGGTFNDIFDGGGYSGAHTTTLSVTGATVSMTGYQYRAVATNGYGEATSAAATLTVNADSPLVDLNGDGNGDVFTYNFNTGAWYRQVTQPGGGFVMESQGSWDPGWLITPARFNDDAQTDFFLFNATSGQWFKMLSNGTGFATEAMGGWWPGWQRLVMDLDGDGISDVFLYDPATGVWFKAVSVAGGFTYQQGGWSPDWELYPMRLNDDALGDLFLINRTTGRWFWVLGQNGPGFSYPVSDAWFPGWQFYPGDYSGDGITDILLHDPATGVYFVAINTGAGFSYVQGGWSLGWQPYAADFNADDKTDLFLHDPATGVWFEMLSDGAGHFANAGGEIWSLGWSLSPTDLNNDQRSDIVLYDPASGVWYQARNLVNGSFSYNSGTWDMGLTIITRVPIR
jgi:hypothetical protein